MVSVLHILQTPLDFTGGPAIYVKELSKQLAKMGVQVGIVAPQHKTPQRELKELGVEIYAIRTSLLPHAALRAPWIFSMKIHTLIKSIISKYDIANIHVESTFLQLVADTFKDKEVIATVHGFPLYEDLETLKHHIDLYKLLHLLFIAPQHTITLSQLLKKSNLVVTVSNHLRRLLTQAYGPISNVITIYNGVDTNFFKPINPTLARETVQKVVKHKCNIDINSKKIILYHARIEPGKGTHILIKSVAKLKHKDDIVLIIEGQPNQPDYLSYLAKLINALDTSRITCVMDPIPRKLLPYLFSAAYVYVLPSLFEGLPATVLESMACGTPVIATRVGGLPEVVFDNINGILVEPGSVDALRHALDRIISEDDLRSKMSKNSRKLIENKFSWANIATQYLKIYDNI